MTPAVRNGFLSLFSAILLLVSCGARDLVLCQNSAEENHIIFRALSGAESRKNPFFIDFGRECDRNHAPPEINATCQETGTPSLDVLH